MTQRRGHFAGPQNFVDTFLHSLQQAQQFQARREQRKIQKLQREELQRQLQQRQEAEAVQQQLSEQQLMELFGPTVSPEARAASPLAKVIVN